ncbi:unnamed protein product [Cuscuta epithymum]|uniref:Uncharacterized protein n=1 Tax=Cuscuta epithymum TaxID=186058 RepID=A0AAV0EZ99_9ASTE|nr:unnamed protein product [Cuscuta epithymum]
MQRIPNEQRRKLLGDIDNLTEETVDEILHNFLCDLKDGKLEANGWQMMLPAYSISKATLHAYTRLVAKKHPDMCINCVHPGYVNTDLNWHTDCRGGSSRSRNAGSPSSRGTHWMLL